jgi:hypothetical protein
MLVLEKFDGAVVRTVGPITAATCPMLGPTKLRGDGVKPGTGKAGRGNASFDGATAVTAALVLATGATTPTVVPRAPSTARRRTVEFICVASFRAAARAALRLVVGSAPVSPAEQESR